MTDTVAGIRVSRETMDRLQGFAQLVEKWNPKINLIAPGTIPQIWGRHIVDSAQLYPLAPAHYAKWVDIGSGGGFPGIIMAILATEFQPQAQFVLIESDQRKSVFLRTAARELQLSAKIIANRIEAAPAQGADIVSARALTTLSGLFPMALRHLGPTGCALFHKGKRAAEEIAEARADWSFQLEEHPSITDPDARLLAIKGISRAS